MKRKAVESILIDFRDGIDTSQPATQIERTALVQLQNCLFTSPGRIESRLGYSKYNSTAISGLSSVRWACRFYDNDGTTKRKYCAGPHTTYEKVYYSSTDDDGTWTEVTGGSNLTKGRMSHVFWKNKIFLSNGTEAIQIIDGTTKSDLSAAPVNPTGKYICLHMERLWVADGTTLYWSDVADETTFETNSFMEVGEDTESIVGVVSFGSKLLIFKPSGVWELWGDPGEWQLEQIPGLPGSISPHTIGTMLGGGGVVWLAREGLAYYDDGSGFQWLKNKNIRAFLDSIDADDFSEIVGIYHDGYFSFHYRYDGSSYNDRGLIYDFHVGGWSSLKGVPVACMVWENGSGDDNEVFFGDSNGGYLYKMFDGYNDDGDKIQIIIEPRHEDFDTKLIKHIRDIFIIAESEDATENLTLTPLFDTDEVQTLITVEADATSTWDNVDWDDFYWDEGGLTRARRRLKEPAKCSSLGCLFTWESDTAQLNFIGLEIYADVLSLRRT